MFTRNHLLFACALGVMTPPVQAGPQLVCDQPVFEFGQADTTQPVRHAFLLRNIGDATALVSRVHASCSCTVPNLARKEIPPGESVELMTQLNLAGRRGNQNRPVYVSWNNPSNEPLRVALVGVAGLAVEVRPLSVFFAPTSTTSQEVAVFTTFSNVTFNVVSAMCENARFDLRVQTVTNGRAYTIVVTDKTPEIREPVAASLTIRTDHPVRGQLNLPIRVGGQRRDGEGLGVAMNPLLQHVAFNTMDHAAVVATPAILKLGTVGPTGTVAGVVHVFGGGAFHVTGVTCANAAFKANVVTNVSGRAYQVEIAYPPPRAPGPVATVVTIATDHPRFPTLDIPVFLRVSDAPMP